jgi:hypothetical protein
MILEGRTSHSCEPTLTDAAVAAFCRDGCLVLEGAVDDATNQRCFAFLDEHAAANDAPELRPNIAEPKALFHEDWFVEGVLLHPAVAGAVRSLLGDDFGLPILMSNHRASAPSKPGQRAQAWHHDSDAHFGPQVECLQVMYYPQDTPESKGPTEVLMGSHHLPVSDRVTTDWTTSEHAGSEQLAAGNAGCKLMASGAGTVFITHYSLLHRRALAAPNGPECTRNMLKFCYWRQTPPRRDWLPSPAAEFSLETFDFGMQVCPALAGRVILALPCVSR